MGWRNNKDTIVTNVIQQTCSILIFLTVPNLLQVDGYAQVVFVGTLLSFITFSDFGLSFVYSRKMPFIFASGDIEEVRRWDETVFSFRMLMAVLFGCGIGLIYYFKYHQALNAALLFLFPILTVIPSFLIAQTTAISNFSTYRKINSYQSIVRLVTIGGVMLFGLLGWFASQLLTGLITVFKVLSIGAVPKKIWIDRGLLKEHFIEGLMLGLITMLWTQLLTSGKGFASFMYSDSEIAQYGLMNTGYQIIATLIISAFVPQTVKAYAMIEKHFQEALDYMFRTILLAIPLVVSLAIISREISSYILMHFFPKYHVDSIVLDALIFSLVFYPIIVTLGAVLVAKKKSSSYLILIAFSLLMNWIMINFLEPYFGYRSAAVAQLVTLFIYSILLMVLIFYYFKFEIRKKGSVFCKIYASLFGILGFYFSLRYVFSINTGS